MISIDSSAFDRAMRLIGPVRRSVRIAMDIGRFRPIVILCSRESAGPERPGVDFGR